MSKTLDISQRRPVVPVRQETREGPKDCPCLLPGEFPGGMTQVKAVVSLIRGHSARLASGATTVDRATRESSAVCRSSSWRLWLGPDQYPLGTPLPEV